ncbi:ORF6N domain-containing protein [Pseudomonas aeruginosa]|uniref:ORF6N domain-containing protein n=1 Tax=Pseudomonas aeruginosa TaxID=287 RepID=UPI00079FEB2E|nr:ORF6N domain-containing protein [Pseudomonas aeruginosa]EJK6085892.1 ORF6N domain-containing protein [Pseudomonas aeruginosa]EKD5495146.1 ORF6N domain-containing protein [Pseudomonas aeruginosa]EKD5525001.1 ORF6N domain-containing protein [Pseudomonas aeruginosa]EKD5562768.1 ORF6N domain-containing protein [Pseudomonas aeruginosa]EKD5595678.1 ORF6N domain-containing protein [Pseudomonas aeruginosa]
MSNAIRQVISIANSDLTIIEHQGKRVVTLAMVDQVHQRPVGTAKRNFHENRSRFEEGKHYFLVPRACADEFRTLGVDIPNRGLTVLTERGYLLLVKSFTDELSWQVQDMLVDGYFEGQRLAAPPVTQRIAMSRHRLALAKELYRTRDPALRQTIHQQLDEVSRAMGLPTPELDSLGRATPAAPDVLQEFWEALASFERQGVAYNHSPPNSGNLSFNVKHLRDLFQQHGIKITVDQLLRNAWRASQFPRFIKNDTVSSTLWKKSIKCWIFRKEG